MGQDLSVGKRFGQNKAMEAIAAIRQVVGLVSNSSAGKTYVDSDTQLVERCASGDQAAWEELVRAHSARVYGICYRFTGSVANAQDLAQEVFLRVFRSLHQFQSGKGRFTVWLTRLTRNLLIDNYRSSKLERATDSMDQRLTLITEKAADSHADHLQASSEREKLLQRALGRLSPDLRETVILRDLEDMEYAEIAKVLEVPEGTVKSRLNRGRAELARMLRPYQGVI